MIDLYKKYKGLVANLCDALVPYDLTCAVETDSYPIFVTISRTEGDETQLKLNDNSELTAPRNQAVIRFSFELSGLKVQMLSSVSMSEELINKIKGAAKKIHYEYLQAFFAEMTALRGIIPANDYEQDEADE